MGGWTTECFKCKEKIEFKELECDQSGFSWHPRCFCCIVCSKILNENSVKLRGEEKNQLFCSMHKFTVEGNQPTCKVYYMPMAYRIVF